MLENQVIFKRYLEDDEEVLWSLKPFAKKYPVIDDLLIMVILQVILIFFAIFFYFITLNVKNDIVSLMWIIIGLINFSILAIIILNFDVGGGHERENLRNSEYFISNKKIFSIKRNMIGFLFLNSKNIVTLPLNCIEYYFTKQNKKKPKPIYDVYLKVKFDSVDKWKDVTLVCKEMKDYQLKEQYPVMIKRPKEGHPTYLDTIKRMKNVYDIDRINAILNGQLGIKIQDPPEDWERYTNL